MWSDFSEIDWRLAGIADALRAGHALPEDPEQVRVWVEETARRIRLLPDATYLADEWQDRYPLRPRHQMLTELHQLWPLLCARAPARSDQPYRWHVFVAHAARDINFVRTLCRAMRAYHLRVWIDRDQLTVGDSIRHTIDTALPQCRYGVVVFSPNSINRTWLHRELDALTQRETTHHKVILPILHKLTPTQLHHVSPLLAGRLALSTEDHPVERVAYGIARAVATGR